MHRYELRSNVPAVLVPATQGSHHDQQGRSKASKGTSKAMRKGKRKSSEEPNEEDQVHKSFTNQTSRSVKRRKISRHDEEASNFKLKVVPDIQSEDGDASSPLSIAEDIGLIAKVIPDSQSQSGKNEEEYSLPSLPSQRASDTSNGVEHITLNSSPRSDVSVDEGFRDTELYIGRRWASRQPLEDYRSPVKPSGREFLPFEDVDTSKMDLVSRAELLNPKDILAGTEYENTGTISWREGSKSSSNISYDKGFEKYLPMKRWKDSSSSSGKKSLSPPELKAEGQYNPLTISKGKPVDLDTIFEDCEYRDLELQATDETSSNSSLKTPPDVEDIFNPIILLELDLPIPLKRPVVDPKIRVEVENANSEILVPSSGQPAVRHSQTPLKKRSRRSHPASGKDGNPHRE